MTTNGSQGWCERHAELFASNGASPEAIFQELISTLSKTWKARSGFNMKTDKESVIRVINKVSNGKPFCCWLGDAKLQAYLINVATKIEKEKADAKSNDRGPDETGSSSS